MKVPTKSSFCCLLATTALLVSAVPTLAAEQSTSHLSFGVGNLELSGSGYYLDQGKWLAIDHAKRKSANLMVASPYPDGHYDLTLKTVGENDGRSTFQVKVNGTQVGEFTSPLSEKAYEEGPKYHATFPKVKIASGDVIEIGSTVASNDGKEWSRARWSELVFNPADEATRKAVAAMKKEAPKLSRPTGPDLQQPRQPDGDGTIEVSGELSQWHKVTLTLNGPFAHELDNKPNPFTDYELNVTFTHESGSPSLTVPGYFAADGRAAETSAKSGTSWRAHLAPEKTGTWTYEVSFLTGPQIINGGSGATEEVALLHGKKGTFEIGASDKTAPDFRSRGRLAYVGKHHLQFLGDKTYFLKAGADAPETALAFADFDDTRTLKKNVPVKSWGPHVRDWNTGDPSWKGDKGKGLIGALNYLSSKGMNAWSFLPYNVDGDGSNVWPFTAPRDKFHYDCSKLDQWGIVFDHSTAKGLFLHFKLQENEIDDNRLGQQAKSGRVPASLDGGKLGPERKLYLREMIARYGHNLALNWNLGEENTQSLPEREAMIGWIRKLDPYGHPVVLHTFPNQQDKLYKPHLGKQADLDGLSLQNSTVMNCNVQVVKWTRESAKAGHPWVVSFDEPGNAQYGAPPDDDYGNMAELRKGEHKKSPTVDDVRKHTLWGTILGGGGGVEYYFGYKLPENDLIAEDWRSRAQSWDDARHALEFFRDQKIPFEEMTSRNELVGNPKNNNSRYCFAKEGEIYLVFLPQGGSTKIELPEGKSFSLAWFNPRTGEMGEAAPMEGDAISAPDKKDWLAVIR